MQLLEVGGLHTDIELPCVKPSDYWDRWPFTFLVCNQANSASYPQWNWKWLLTKWE